VIEKEAARMKAICTVIGTDRVGIIAAVSNALSSLEVNILDISQTVVSGYFTMMMLVDAQASALSFAELVGKLQEIGQEMGVEIRMQRTEIFDAMHRV